MSVCDTIVNNARVKLLLFFFSIFSDQTIALELVLLHVCVCESKRFHNRNVRFYRTRITSVRFGTRNPRSRKKSRPLHVEGTSGTQNAVHREIRAGRLRSIPGGSFDRVENHIGAAQGRCDV